MRLPKQKEVGKIYFTNYNFDWLFVKVNHRLQLLQFLQLFCNFLQLKVKHILPTKAWKFCCKTRI